METSFRQSLLAGACAGTSVDILFFPLDTLKTRLQAKEGFLKAGGFKGIYRGLGSVVVGSAPGAALFFVTYDSLKSYLPRIAKSLGSRDTPAVHMLAASGGEMAACLVRVPTEVVKQRQQTSAYGSTSSTFNALRMTVTQGGLAGLYRGYATTVMREIPFSCVQFPLYERLKMWSAKKRRIRVDQLPASDAAVCGSLSGGFSAAVTTPLDVAKTRIMLNRSAAVEGTFATLRRIYVDEGLAALFRGVVPRTLWMSLGGATFLGVYELCKTMQV